MEQAQLLWLPRAVPSVIRKKLALPKVTDTWGLMLYMMAEAMMYMVFGMLLLKVKLGRFKVAVHVAGTVLTVTVLFMLLNRLPYISIEAPATIVTLFLALYVFTVNAQARKPVSTILIGDDTKNQ